MLLLNLLMLWLLRLWLILLLQLMLMLLLLLLLLLLACAPFVAAEGISIAFGRVSSTDECGSGENTGRRSEFEMLHQKWPHWHAWKCVAGVG